MVLTWAMAADDGRKLKRELASYLRDQDQAKLRLLRARINAAKVERRHALARTRGACKSARMGLKERHRREREALRDKQREERAKGKTVCELKKEEIERSSGERLSELSAELREEKTLSEQLKRTARSKSKAIRKTSAIERRQESDDEVRANIPEELVPVFDAVRKEISGGPRRSRTEAFLEWVEAHPGEVWSIQQSEADQALAAMIREYEQTQGEVRERGRYRKSPAELRAMLEPAPF